MSRTQTGIRGQIAEMVDRIIERFHPERIILFGSHARGEAGGDSDVDLLVVMPVKGSKREKAVEIGVALHDFPVPKDVLVVTPEEFQRRKEIVGTVERPADREGKVLYAQPVRTDFNGGSPSRGSAGTARPKGHARRFTEGRA